MGTWKSSEKSALLLGDTPKRPDVRPFPVHDAFMTLPRYTSTREVIIASDEMQQQKKERSSMNRVKRWVP
jgi:hypothetical protein